MMPVKIFSNIMLVWIFTLAGSLSQPAVDILQSNPSVAGLDLIESGADWCGSCGSWGCGGVTEMDSNNRSTV